MFYTNLGRVLAGLGFALGLAGIAIGLASASGDHDPSALVGTKTSGQWIDRGIYTLICSVVIGVLTDISRSVARLTTRSGTSGGD